MQKKVQTWGPLVAAAVTVSSAPFGCAGRSRPAVMPNPVMLPDYEPQRNGAYLESTWARPTAEQRKSLSPEQQRVETVAATAAAIVGSLSSASPNAIVGTETPFEENDLFVKKHEQPEAAKSTDDLDDTSNADDDNNVRDPSRCPEDGVILALRIYASSCRGSARAPR